MMPRALRSLIDKTLKREIAIALLAYLCLLSWSAMSGDDPALIEARTALIRELAWPIMSFAGLAFGMEWVSKQTAWTDTPTVQPTPTNPKGEIAG